MTRYQSAHIAHYSLTPLQSIKPSLVDGLVPCSCAAWQWAPAAGTWSQVTFAGWAENCLKLVKLNQTAAACPPSPPPLSLASCWVLDWTRRIWISYFSTEFPSTRVQVWQTDNFHFSSFLGSPCKVFSLASTKLIPALSTPSSVSRAGAESNLTASGG